MTAIGTLVSLNVGMPVMAMHGKKEVETGIFKKPAGRPLLLGESGLEGDGQADLINHGGKDKAVCVYSVDHYPFWASRWGRGNELEPGSFGENFSVSGLTEQSLSIGDIIRIGEAVLQVSQPRQPCFKLALKMERPTFPKAFLRSGRTGFYLRVLEEGELGPGDPIELVSREPGAVTVEKMVRLTYGV